VRDDHLYQLCKRAVRIRAMLESRHDSRWSFVWDPGPGVQFPSVLKNGEEVMPTEYDD